MNKYFGAAIAAAVSLGMAGQASATVHHLTYSGHVTEALDVTGEFGVGVDLVGKSFKAFVTYDDAKPGASHLGDVGYDYYFGADTSNPLTATILLNGVTKTFGIGHGADSSGQDYRQDNSLNPACLFDCAMASFQQNATDRFIDGGFYTLNYINLGAYADDGQLGGLAHTAPNYTNPPLTNLYGFVNLFTQNMDTLDETHYAEVSVKIDRVGAGVPEPAAWSLMIVGFAGLGASLRARRRAAAAA